MYNRQYLLNPDEMPTKWYNIAADFGEMPPPPLNAKTNQPAGPAIS